MAQCNALLLATLLLGVYNAGVSAAATEALGSTGRMLLGDHKYKKADEIELYANKVGPFQNPT